MGEVVILKIK